MESRKHVLVAGAEGFLGRNAMMYFHERGYSVAGSCLNAGLMQELTAWLKDKGIAAPVLEVAELTDESAVKGMLDRADAKIGGLDCLFNAAGGFTWTKIADAKPADAKFLLDANFTSCFLLAKHAVPLLAKSGAGRIVFMSAAASLAPAAPGMGIYAASKAAVNCLVQALAAECRDQNVTVNALCPTVLDTPRNRKDMPDADPKTWVTTDEVLSAAEFLFGAGAVNGALIRVGGKL